MLLYEEGGHFKTHRDTEKEPGMFGSLLIQLPAEHEGGCLVVEHSGKTKRFEFSKDSGDKAFYSSFYADCEHMLEPVTQGLRLVLAFNLVRGVETKSKFPEVASATDREGFEEALISAAKSWTDDIHAVQKLVYPFEHMYTETNMSFEGLKGKDLQVATLLQNAIDPETNGKLFTVFIAMVTKHVTGTEEEGYGYGYGHRYGGGGGMDMGCDIETDYETDTWVAADEDDDLDVNALKVDLTEELLEIVARREDGDCDEDEANEMVEKIFGEDPDNEESEGYQGNYAGTIEYWYNSAVLVFWPAARDFDIKLAASPSQAIEMLEDMEDHSSADFQDKLSRLLVFLSSTPSAKWSPQSLLPLTQTLDQVKTVLTMCSKIVLAETDVKAILAVIGVHGLTALSQYFQSVLRSQTLRMSTVILDLVKNQCVAEQMAAVYSSIATAAQWVAICNFVILNCDLEAQATVAIYLGGKMVLGTLNHLIKNVTQEQQGFLPRLRSCAVYACVHKNQSTQDVMNVVEWIIHGEYAELMAELRPKLLTLCNTPALFRSLFALPSVVAAMKTDSPISADLESLVQARIAAVVNHTTPPPFSWCMPDVKNSTNDPRVIQFLASPAQQIHLNGFGGIQKARTLAEHFGGGGGYDYGYHGNYGSVRIATVDAVASGTGAKSAVTLTKNKSHYNAIVTKCAENLIELNNLRKMLRVRDASAVSVSSSSANTSSSSNGIGVNSGSIEVSEQHLDKKVKVEGGGGGSHSVVPLLPPPIEKHTDSHGKSVD
eukprot:gene32944-40665_t